jgi:hypothetical protein
MLEGGDGFQCIDNGRKATAYRFLVGVQATIQLLVDQGMLTALPWTDHTCGIVEFRRMAEFGISHGSESFACVHLTCPQ